MMIIIPSNVRLLTSAPNSPEVMKVWIASMSLVRRLVRPPSKLVVVVIERKSVDMRVQGLAKIVHHILAHAGGQISLGISGKWRLLRQ